MPGMGTRLEPPLAIVESPQQVSGGPGAVTGVTRILGLGALPLAVFLSLAAPWPASPAHAQGSPTQIVIAQPAEDFHVGHERRVGLDASPHRSAEQPSNPVGARFVREAGDDGGCVEAITLRLSHRTARASAPGAAPAAA